MGDFNIVLNVERSVVTSTPSVSTQLLAYMNDWGLVDIWRQKYPDLRDYNYSAHYRSYSRIDMIQGSVNISSHVSFITIGKRLYSDHAPVIMV